MLSLVIDSFQADINCPEKHKTFLLWNSGPEEATGSGLPCWQSPALFSASLLEVSAQQERQKAGPGLHSSTVQLSWPNVKMSGHERDEGPRLEKGWQHPKALDWLLG